MAGAAGFQCFVTRQDGRARGRAEGRRRAGRADGDRGGALLDVAGVQQSAGRHRHEVRIALVLIAIGIHQPRGLDKRRPRARIVLAPGVDRKLLEDFQRLQ